MLVRKLQQCEQRRRQERGIKGEIILIKLAGAGDNDQVTALNAGPKYENQSQKLFLDLGLMLLFRAGRVPASPTNANGNGVTTNIYEEVGNILIGLRIIRLRQTKLDIGLSLPEPEPPELRTPHINIWDMIYNKREREGASYPGSQAGLRLQDHGGGPALGVAGVQPDIDLLPGRKLARPEARHVPGPVSVHDVVRQTEHLHVERLLEAAVEPRVADDADADQSLVSHVTVMRCLRDG